MSIYLKYRLEKSNISPGDIRDIRIYAAKEKWIFQDIRAELLEIFPTANVSSFEEIFNTRCDMVFIPYMSVTDTPRYKYSALSGVLKLKPRYIGFYEFSKRHLLIVKRKSLPLFFIHKMIEYVLRFILRIKNKIPRLKTGETRQK
jgi:hypothetical protein